MDGVFERMIAVNSLHPDEAAGTGKARGVHRFVGKSGLVRVVRSVDAQIPLVDPQELDWSRSLSASERPSTAIARVTRAIFDCNRRPRSHCGRQSLAAQRQRERGALALYF